MRDLNMNRLASLVLLVVGGALLASGWDAYHSIGSGLATVIGRGGLARGSK